jgi:hypothetical protein
MYNIPLVPRILPTPFAHNPQARVFLNPRRAKPSQTKLRAPAQVPMPKCHIHCLPPVTVVVVPTANFDFPATAPATAPRIILMVLPRARMKVSLPESEMASDVTTADSALPLPALGPTLVFPIMLSFDFRLELPFPPALTLTPGMSSSSCDREYGP